MMVVGGGGEEGREGEGRGEGVGWNMRVSLRRRVGWGAVVRGGAVGREKLGL